MAEQERFSFEEELEKLRDREPFVPFTITVAGGDRSEITADKRDALGDNLIVVLAAKRGISFFRKNRIVSVDVHEPASQGRDDEF